jgi:hypothetical protein
MVMNPSGEQFYSAGLDSIISVWNLPSPEVDPYDPYGNDDDDNGSRRSTFSLSRR